LAKVHGEIVLEPWESRLKPRGKPELPVEIHVNAMRDTDRGLRGFHWIIRDIRLRKEAESRVLESQRLSAIGEMMASLAHESRNALQRSQACISMLGVELKDRPEALSLIERLRTAQQHLNRLYEDVRRYSGPHIVERTPCDLLSLLDETWSELLTLYPDKQARLTHRGRAHCNTQAAVDSFALAQVLRNILENALAACPAPVSVIATWRDMWLPDNCRAVELRIRDNGPGLSEEAREKIFQPFFTTKSQGTGLGMAIAKRIIDEHGGTISVGDGTAGGAELIVVLSRSAP
jgi:signal transduction histidine kinase